jgi:hypothetical protein
MFRQLALFFIGLTITFTVFAQETLPKFSAVLKTNGKTIISWKNNYPVVKQISVQRSLDSLKNFMTILTVPDPTVAENGLVDAKTPAQKIFYRLFIVLDSGKYIFTKSQKPIVDTAARIVVQTTTENENDNFPKAKNEGQRISYLKKNTDQVTINAPGNEKKVSEVPINKMVFIKLKDSVIGELFEKSIKKFKDSILAKTKDTLVFKGNDTIVIRPYVPKEVYKISSFVFTGKEGNVNISLPFADKKKYSVKFLEMDGSLLFEVKDIKQPLLIVDKTNFVHAGWFRFELFEESTLKEKNKFFIPKDF